MKFSDILGSTSEFLRGEMQSAHVVHAYLFAGPAGTGKRTLADICARALLCTGSGERPCGVCPACLQYESGNHPDILRVQPERSIGVDMVRELNDALAVKPYEADKHVALIEQVDKMTPQAQNALLKTLEDPPGNAVFFLTTAQLSAVLPTIISRCRVVRFPLLEEEQAVKALKAHGMSEKRACLLARLSLGSVGQALEMEASEQYWKTREIVIKALNTLHAPHDVGVAALMLVELKDLSAIILDILELCARDIMVMQDGQGEVIQLDLEDNLPTSRFQGDRMLQAVMEARRRLASNVSWQSVVEMLFFEIAGGNHTWQ